MNKKALILFSMLSIITVGLLTSRSVFAQDEAGSSNSMSSLVTRIAEKFGLNKDEVQAVFDADRQERQEKRQEEFQARLDQDVADGKITEAQKELIIAKRNQLEENRRSGDSLEGLSKEERKSVMEAERKELESWASENNIDPKYLMGGGRGPGGPRIPPGDETPAN